MSKIPASNQAGFSAVELLITLFIAVAFIASAYQLYAVILDDSGSARKQSYASNVAYQMIRQYSPAATAKCSSFVPTPLATMPAGNELQNATVTVQFSCPFGFGSETSKLTVSVKYDTPQKEVVHAIYVFPN